MDFWSPLLEQLWDARTPFLVAAFLATRALVRFAPRAVEGYHLRGAATMLLGHLLALTIGVAQHAYGYEGRIAEVTSFAFAALCTLILAITAAFRVVLPRVGFVLPRILVDLLTAVGIVVVFIGVGRRAGFSLAGLITTSAVLTAVIGLSLQETLGNMMGGLSVQLDKSIAVGDWITVNGVHGRVSEIRWRYTAIEMRNWDTAIVPNGVLVKSQVVIMGRRQGMPLMQRRQIDFYVDFRTAPTEVLSNVLRALVDDPVPNMARDPQPQVLFMGVRDSYVHYAARYWLDDLVPDDATDSAVRTRIWFALRRAGIAMSIPASSVFVTHETPGREQRKAEREHAQRMRAISRVDLFDRLSEDQRNRLADQLQFVPYSAGEAVTREGDRDDGLFMIVEGEAVVRIGRGARDSRDVARLAAGEFFGEMSLMTGEVRTATVLAATDLVCYRLNKDAFQAILEETPAMAEQVADILMTRKSALSAARDEHGADGHRRMETAKRDLASRIRGFFGLDAAR